MARAVRTWVLVTDGSRARVYENTGPGEGLSEVLSQEIRALTHELFRDRLSRGAGPHGAERNVVAEPSPADPGRYADPQRVEQREYARYLCSLVDRKAGEGAFERLIVAAAPPALRDLRAMMSDRVRAMVFAEVDRDCMRHSPRDLTRHLADFARF